MVVVVVVLVVAVVSAVIVMLSQKVRAGGDGHWIEDQALKRLLGCGQHSTKPQLRLFSDGN